MEEIESNTTTSSSGAAGLRTGGRISAGTILGAAIWLTVVLAAMICLINYSNVPGAVGAVPQQWPAESRIGLDGTRPTLIMFAHPRCPCTRASLGELEVLMARCQGKVSAHVLFIQPVGTSGDWNHTELWRKAAAIPGVTVHRDDLGSEAERFHSETSGQTLLFDPNGDLLFQGGITISRGHAGDNPGRSALVSLLEHSLSNHVTTPVFGCPLFDDGCGSDKVPCNP